MLLPHAVAPVLVQAKSPGLAPIIGNGVKCRTLFWTFFTVTVNGLLVTPTIVAGNFKDTGETVTAATPDPLSETVSELLGPVEVTVAVPAGAAARAAGVRVTATVQLLVAASVAPQVEWRVSIAYSPGEAVIDKMSRVVV
jgi:hypothetical protein